MSNAVTTQPKNKIGFTSFMTTPIVQKKVNEVVGGERGQRFISSIVSAVTTNPLLKECTNESIFSGALLGESLNLSPSPQLGLFYLVPFNDKNKGKIAQFQLGFKGYINLAIRTGQYKDIDVIEIREGEYLGRDKDNGKQKFQFIEDENERENKEIIGYMAYFEMINGFTKKIYWTKEKMEKHALKYSQAYKNDKSKKTNYSFWSNNFDEMAFKTLLRQLISKWGVMSIDMQTAFEKDMAVIKDNGDFDYVDTIEDNATIIESVEQPIEIKSLDDID